MSMLHIKLSVVYETQFHAVRQSVRETDRETGEWGKCLPYNRCQLLLSHILLNFSSTLQFLTCQTPCRFYIHFLFARNKLASLEDRESKRVRGRK